MSKDSKPTTLKEARTIKGLTQTELGKKIGVRAKYPNLVISLWERREREIPQEYQTALSKVLGVKLETVKSWNRDYKTKEIPNLPDCTMTLKERRQYCGYTQEKLGKHLGYSTGSAQNTVSRWERGKEPIPHKLRRRIAEKLNVSTATVDRWSKEEVQETQLCYSVWVERIGETEIQPPAKWKDAETQHEALTIVKESQKVGITAFVKTEVN